MPDTSDVNRVRYVCTALRTSILGCEGTREVQERLVRDDMTRTNEEDVTVDVDGVVPKSRGARISGE
jgi:hypothetical protein